MLNPQLELSPRQVRAMMDEPGQKPLLIDCREESEWKTARIEGARLIPLGEFSAKLDSIVDELEDQERPVVVHCHHGMRSLKATLLLRSRGVEAKSMAGGIDLWSVDVDPGVPRY